MAAGQSKRETAKGKAPSARAVPARMAWSDLLVSGGPRLCPRTAGARTTASGLHAAAHGIKDSARARTTSSAARRHGGKLSTSIHFRCRPAGGFGGGARGLRGIGAAAGGTRLRAPDRVLPIPPHRAHAAAHARRGAGGGAGSARQRPKTPARTRGRRLPNARRRDRPLPHLRSAALRMPDAFLPRRGRPVFPPRGAGPDPPPGGRGRRPRLPRRLETVGRRRGGNARRLVLS